MYFSNFKYYTQINYQYTPKKVANLEHADFFVGLSSGLSWLAWTCKVPVVMISGFTHPTNEFATPYRIINYHTCHSCWNDMRENFDHFDFLWCPRHKGTDRHFECTKLISPEQVITTIKKIPSFKPEEAKVDKTRPLEFGNFLAGTCSKTKLLGFT